MPTLDISEEIIEFFDYVEGDTPRKKIIGLIKSDLRECEEEIYKFEIRYGSIFKGFTDAWDRREIQDKYSYRIERDHMV